MTSGRPLNVLQLVLSLEIGGLERLVSDMVRRFDPGGVRPVVCCLDRIGSFGSSLQRDGFEVYELGRKPGRDWSLVPALGKVLRAERIDVVHAHQYSAYFFGLFASLYATARYLGKRPALVYTSHGIPFPFVRDRRHAFLNPILFSFASAIVTISGDTRRNLVRFENLPGPRIGVVHNGIGTGDEPSEEARRRQRAALGIPDGVQAIGVVARLDAVKNHAMLLRALKRVVEQRPATCLVIVGDGPERRALERLTAELGVGQAVRFLGARTNAAELVEGFDVAVLPSFSEGMSVTLLEAMARGVPVVATDVGGNPEVVQDGLTGLLVPSDDDGAMATAVLRLLSDDSCRRGMGKAARERAVSVFPVCRTVDTYAELYRRVARS